MEFSEKGNNEIQECFGEQFHNQVSNDSLSAYITKLSLIQTLLLY
jgi:hypothetical protein